MSEITDVEKYLKLVKRKGLELIDILERAPKTSVNDYYRRIELVKEIKRLLL